MSSHLSKLYKLFKERRNHIFKPVWPFSSCFLSVRIRDWSIINTSKPDQVIKGWHWIAEASSYCSFHQQYSMEILEPMKYPDLCKAANGSQRTCIIVNKPEQNGCFRRWHFQMPFLQRKFLYYDSSFLIPCRYILQFLWFQVKNNIAKQGVVLFMICWLWCLGVDEPISCMNPVYNLIKSIFPFRDNLCDCLINRTMMWATLGTAWDPS